MAQTQPASKPDGERSLRQTAFLAIIAITAIILAAGFLLPTEAPPAPAEANAGQQPPAAAAPRGEAPPELVKQIDGLKERIKANPKDLVALIQLGDIYAVVAATDPNYLKQAEELYNKAVEVDPAYPVAYARLGDLNYDLARANADQLDTRRMSQAANYYIKTLELAPKDIEVRSKLAVCYISQDLFAPAIQELKKVIELKPDDMRAHYILGFAYARNNPPDTKAAIAAWEAVVRLAPESQEAKDALKQIEKYKK